ncbi:MAG TPA: hypothetical protein VIG64_14710 [Actinomycetota bacterium]|jgi:hypothetical protein
MRLRALFCAAVLTSLMASAAHAGDPMPKPGTTFEATTKGSPVTAMTGHWVEDDMSARLVFAGVHAVGTRTDMKATWTTDFAPKAKSGALTVECYRVSGSVEDKANKWSVEVRMIPRSRLGKGVFRYSTRVPMTELGSGEGMGVSVETFRAERWKYQVIVQAHIVNPSEMSGTCTMEAG